ncbi:hypothetical protein THAOC_13822 [Thalassiosira oceanica]|uniref:Uncharacterized protein n=1 Tax=Thalassiosira oceanica TaxID=159749 RepID=K0SWG4_THAOC|nr:hypothetical protein THAOC_13822 [Thalassiosira oceanica]|eukprot:EJK65326.1 hypothetical protein THAOC_13822 [Thalassiosira oceanica]
MPDSTFSNPNHLQMEGMFYNATAFNQDLCHFGDNFSQLQDVTAMFNDTDCADTYNPTSATGPWCAVTSCPAEENNQNIDTPTISPMPTTGTPSTASPSTTAPSTTAPTAPEDEVIYSQNFDYPLNGVFPDDYDDAMDGLSLGWMTGGGLAPLDSDTLPGARRRLHRQLTEEGFRRLQDDTNDINPYFDWMISTEESLSLPNSISPPNLMNSAINVNMTRAVSYAMFVTGEDWGQGELSFDFWTDANPDDEFHEIEIFWTDDLDGGSLNFDTDLRNTGGVWDDHGLILPEGRHYVIIRMYSTRQKRMI